MGTANVYTSCNGIISSLVESHDRPSIESPIKFKFQKAYFYPSTVQRDCIHVLKTLTFSLRLIDLISMVSTEINVIQLKKP
jgi:hypothetical protein